ncbi:MAG TPA: NADH-quinone oxidoreductase subunit M [Flavobacterium sp.]|jgi:NADH-quinone oxidoreductase subunit M|uniref:complex I subunit 4 family protein n=1 Tax=Flavobacterium sp. TaxID=239 RepID=UPI002CF4A548|nr:NADH-quinone oxidoreductase subunit M [Bacteroidota bacterium]HPW97425.1 NADH-quinone oxidoreductase subunit M [Flavobacterium sp.]
MNVTLLLLLLLTGSIVTFLSGDKLASKIALLFSVSAFAVSLYLLMLFNQGEIISYMSSWMQKPNVSFALKADGLSLAMVLLTTGLTPLIILSSFGNSYTNSKNFYALVLFMAFSMTGTFLAADGLLYYVFWELALIPIYFIALIWGNGDAEKRKKAVVKFFIYTLAGSLFMLVAFAYLYSKAGSFILEDLYQLRLSETEQFWIFFAFFAAYAIKIPIIPFHTWQAKVYQKAPTVGTMLLSGIMLKMGLYSVIRWQLPIAPDAAKTYMPYLIGVSVAGVIYGSVVALRQKDLKKLLAYSSLAHVGLIAAGCYTLTADGLNGAVYQMIAHGFVIVGLFFAAEVIFRRFETRKINELGGIRSQASKFTSMFMILVLASVALPGTYNFVGEFTVLYSLSQINIWFAVFGGTTIILGAYYMLKMFQNVMLGDTNTKVFADVTLNETIVFVTIIGFLLFFGLYPKPINELVNPAIQNILTVINRS